jgi:tRNA/rRNA methyltransferase
MSSDRFDNVYVILVEPRNAGNIGSVTRAMKNMGIPNLRLVNPVPYRDEPEQRMLGYRSQEIIAASQEFPTLADALADIQFTFLATAKSGTWKQDFFTPDEAAEKVVERMDGEKIALVFGREDRGVTVDESQLANACIHIPSAVYYPSLNLSQAVMVVVYEIYKFAGRHKRVPRSEHRATQNMYDRIFNNVWHLMKSLDFTEDKKGLFHRSLRRALNRTDWAPSDVAVLDRICKQVRWYTKKEAPEDI